MAGASCTVNSASCRGRICSRPRFTTRRMVPGHRDHSRNVARGIGEAAQRRGWPPRVPEGRRDAEARRDRPHPELGAAYELIASQGAAAFYKGAIAKAIVKTSERLGGKMTAADLAEFSSEWVTPVSTEYHGWKVYELPPNSQGIGPLGMLNILSTFPRSPMARARCEGVACADRGSEADIRGSAPVHRGPARQQGPGRGIGLCRICTRARQDDRVR